MDGRTDGWTSQPKYQMSIATERGTGDRTLRSGNLKHVELVFPEWSFMLCLPMTVLCVCVDFFYNMKSLRPGKKKERTRVKGNAGSKSTVSFQ